MRVRINEEIGQRQKIEKIASHYNHGIKIIESIIYLTSEELDHRKKHASS